MAKKDPRLKELARMLKDDIGEDDLSEYRELFLEFLGEGFTELTDERQIGKVRHSLVDCIGIVLFCAFSDVDEWIEMELFAKDNIDTLKKYLALPNGIPSHDTLERVIAIIKPDELQDVLVSVLRNTIQKASELQGNLYEDPELEIYIKDIVAIDGKETRNSGDPNKENVRDQRNYDVLNVQSTETGITLSATRIDEKTNEIPEAQAVLKKLDLRGCIVTADALNTQKNTVLAITQSAHADYCLAVKSNQKRLYDDLRMYFEDKHFLEKIKKDGNYLKETEKSSGKISIWEHYITGDVKWFSEKELWNKLRSFGYVRKKNIDTKTGKETVEERYYICSFRPAVELFALTIRRHWHIENLLHWALDVVFKEDSLRTREKKALHNLGLVNRFVLSVLKILKPYYNNISFRYMRRKIGRNLEKELPVIFAVLKKMYEMGAWS